MASISDFLSVWQHCSSYLGSQASSVLYEVCIAMIIIIESETIG